MSYTPCVCVARVRGVGLGAYARRFDGPLEKSISTSQDRARSDSVTAFGHGLSPGNGAIDIFDIAFSDFLPAFS